MSADAEEIVWADPTEARSYIARLIELGLSQAEIARRVGVTKPVINNLIHNGYDRAPAELVAGVLAIEHDTRQGAWTDRGTCKTPEALDIAMAYGFEQTVDLYFPPEWVDKAGLAELAEEADAICSVCPVRDECLTYAIDHDAHGRWAGTDEKERKRLRRERRRKGTK